MLSTQRSALAIMLLLGPHVKIDVAVTIPLFVPNRNEVLKKQKVLREHVWEYQSMCASGSLRFRSKFAGMFPLGCGSIVQSPWKSFWREPWNLDTPQKWPKYHIIYGSRNESRHSVYEQAMNKTPSSQHCLTLEEFLERYRLATPGSQKTRSITPWRHKWSSWK